jgi:hypothetical protein
MDENNISKYRSDPTVEGGVIAVRCFWNSFAKCFWKNKLAFLFQKIIWCLLKIVFGILFIKMGWKMILKNN